MQLVRITPVITRRSNRPAGETRYFISFVPGRSGRIKSDDIIARLRERDGNPVNSHSGVIQLSLYSVSFGVSDISFILPPVEGLNLLQHSISCDVRLSPLSIQAFQILATSPFLDTELSVIRGLLVFPTGYSPIVVSGCFVLRSETVAKGSSADREFASLMYNPCVKACLPEDDEGPQPRNFSESRWRRIG